MSVEKSRALRTKIGLGGDLKPQARTRRRCAFSRALPGLVLRFS